MYSESEDNCTANFLWTASKLIQDISNKKTYRESDLNSLRIAFRSRRFNFVNFNKQRLYLCPKCNSPWKEGKFSMRIRGNQVHKSRRKRTNLQIVLCHVCQNRSKSIMSKPESNIVRLISSSQTEPVSNVLIKKKKRKKDKLAGLNIPSAPLNSNNKHDKLAGLNIPSAPLNSNNKQCFKINSKESNIEKLSGGCVSVDVAASRNIAAANHSKLTVSSNNLVQSSSHTSHNLLLLSSNLLKHTNTSNKSTKNSKKEKLKKKKHKVNQLKNFINSL